MPLAKKYLFIVSMDVQKDKEALFNEVYDKEHIPLLSKVPGVGAVTRLKTEPAAFNIGGEKKVLDGAGMANYVAIYEIDSPDVLLSKEWAAAGEKGRWPKEVRPYTFNRSHVVRKVI
jgi:hypothetical protein